VTEGVKTNRVQKIFETKTEIETGVWIQFHNWQGLTSGNPITGFKRREKR
jgi:hypothetical protein